MWPVSRKHTVLIFSIVVPFWGCLIGSLICNWFNPQKGTTMETRGQQPLDQVLGLVFFGDSFGGLALRGHSECVSF